MDTAVRPRRWSLVVAGLLQVLVLWLYLLSVLIAPQAGVIGLLVLWAVLVVVTVLVQRRWGPLALLVPLVALGAWFAVIRAGAAWLGWQA